MTKSRLGFMFALFALGFTSACITVEPSPTSVGTTAGCPCAIPPPCDGGDADDASLGDSAPTDTGDSTEDTGGDTAPDTTTVLDSESTSSDMGSLDTGLADTGTAEDSGNADSGTDSADGALIWDPVIFYGASLGLALDHAPTHVTLNGNTVAVTSDLGPRGRNLTQTNPAVQPLYNSAEQDFNDRSALLSMDAIRYMDSAVWPLDAQPETVTWVAEMTSGSGTAAWVFDNLTTSMQAVYGATPTTWLQAGPSSYLDTGFSFRSTDVTWLSGWPETHVYQAVFAGANSHMDVDGIPGPRGQAGSNGRTGFRLGARGGATASGPFIGKLGYVLDVRREETVAELARDAGALLQMYLPGEVIIDGDSRTVDNGGHVAIGLAWPTVMRTTRALGRPIRLHNLAVGGSITTNGLARATTQVTAWITSRRPANDVVLWFGINDLLPPNNRTAAAAFADEMATADVYAAAGARVTLCTEIEYNATPAQVAVKLEFNTLLRNNGRFRVEDLAADGRIHSTDPLCMPDGQHPSALCEGYIEEDVANSLR